MGSVSQEEGTREYVRKNGSETYEYLPPELVLLEHHGGYSVENEGIDVQAGRGGGGLYMSEQCTHSTRFL
jgi:hypothetical protein